MGKPDTDDEATGKSSHRATNALSTLAPGVEGDSARGQISRGTWEARSRVGEPLRLLFEEAELENALITLAPRVSEKPLVATKRGNSRCAFKLLRQWSEEALGKA